MRKKLTSLEKFQNSIIEKCAELAEKTPSSVFCECDQYCQCSSGLVYPTEVADAIRKLKV